jgi:hypothetical protein
MQHSLKSTQNMGYEKAILAVIALIFVASIVVYIYK